MAALWLGGLALAGVAWRSYCRRERSRQLKRRVAEAEGLRVAVDEALLRGCESPTEAVKLLPGRLELVPGGGNTEDAVRVVWTEQEQLDAFEHYRKRVHDLVVGDSDWHVEEPALPVADVEARVPRAEYAGRFPEEWPDSRMGWRRGGGAVYVTRTRQDERRRQLRLRGAIGEYVKLVVVFLRQCCGSCALADAVEAEVERGDLPSSMTLRDVVRVRRDRLDIVQVDGSDAVRVVWTEQEQLDAFEHYRKRVHDLVVGDSDWHVEEPALPVADVEARVPRAEYAGRFPEEWPDSRMGWRRGGGAVYVTRTRQDERRRQLRLRGAIGEYVEAVAAFMRGRGTGSVPTDAVEAEVERGDLPSSMTLRDVVRVRSNRLELVGDVVELIPSEGEIGAFGEYVELVEDFLERERPYDLAPSAGFGDIARHVPIPAGVPVGWTLRTCPEDELGCLLRMQRDEFVLNYSDEAKQQLQEEWRQGAIKYAERELQCITNERVTGTVVSLAAWGKERRGEGFPPSWSLDQIVVKFKRRVRVPIRLAVSGSTAEVLPSEQEVVSLLDDTDSFVRGQDDFYAPGYCCPLASVDHFLREEHGFTLRWDRIARRHRNRIRINRKRALTLLYLTPHRGKDRVFGEYQCMCGKWWKSGNSWCDKWQACKSCGKKVYPWKQRPLKKGHGQQDGARHHEQSLCEMCRDKAEPCSAGSRSSSAGASYARDSYVDDY